MGLTAETGIRQALFADSLRMLERSGAFSKLRACRMFGMSAGPAFSVLWFYTHDNEWTLPELHNLIVVGLGLRVIGTMLLWCLSDVKTVSKSEEGYVGKSSAEDDVVEAEREGCCLVQPKRVPPILLISSIITALGSGMTVKFFPLFFKEDMNMSPAQVQLIYFATPMTVAVFGFVTSELGRRVGRVHAVLRVKIIAISLLVAMVLFRHTVPVYVICVLYVLRTGMMNSGFPVTESILMDFLPREKRGRWKSLQAVTVFGWSGSAVFGGFFGDRYGYAHTFLITAAVQLTGLLLLVPLIPVVPPERCKSVSEVKAEEHGSYHSEEEGDCDEERGLLGSADQSSRAPSFDD